MQDNNNEGEFDWGQYEAALNDPSQDVNKWSLEVQFATEETVVAKLFAYGVELPYDGGQTLNDIRVGIQNRIIVLSAKAYPGQEPLLPVMIEKANLERQAELCFLAESMANALYAYSNVSGGVAVDSYKQRAELDIIDSHVLSAEDKAKLYASLDNMVPVDGLIVASVDDIHDMREEANAFPVSTEGDTENIRDFLGEVFFREEYENNGGYNTFMGDFYTFIYIVRTTDDIELWREAKSQLVMSGLAAGIPSEEVGLIAGLAAKLVECDPSGL